MNSPNSTSPCVPAPQHERGSLKLELARRAQRGFAWASLLEASSSANRRAFSSRSAGTGVESGGELRQRGLRLVLPNKSLERTVDYRGPHPGCQLVLAGSVRQAATWSAAQLRR